MLTGRESLRRVIGRRRRFLPNRSSISSTSDEACSSSRVSAEGDSIEIGVNRGDEVAGSVNCPVCMIQLPGRDNAIINSHLDKCLARGSKRKLGQLTLLQLDFSRSKIKICSTQPNDDRNHDILCYTNETEVSEPTCNFNECELSKENGNNKSYILRKNPLESKLEDFLTNESADNLLISGTEGSKCELDHDSDNCDISEVSIPTFIVGHKYGNREKLYPGSKLCLFRDPGNIKDANAIKVIHADFESDDMLGYIPREVAQHLAPVIDKFHLNFEGSIVSLPKDPRAAIAIQIVCKNVELSDGDIEELKALWKHSLHEITISKPHRMTRYQQNMVLLIQEVLKDNSHLFTVSEKSFLEAFDSLPDDCQRLFARLYTRKGPWFRVSNISYPEIADCDQAVKGLLGSYETIHSIQPFYCY